MLTATGLGMDDFLAPSKTIDFEESGVANLAKQLSQGATSEHEVIASCFEFVRDQIKHSWDYQLDPVTCNASDVLKHRTGYCYAKSHLLAALLRANNIPTGLCYQRLTITDRPPFCLHGLNAVYLTRHGWFRIDARGNKPGVTASFEPPIENLAFPIVTEGESDLPEIWAEPLTVVVNVLENSGDYREVAENLPDID